MAPTGLSVRLRRTDSIRPYKNNPRVNDQAVDAVAASIQEFGFRQPIVVDGKGVIVIGHTRWKAAQKLGLAKVPVHVASDLTKKQARAYRIADKKTAELADWDLGLLAAEFADLGDGVDWSAFGFTSAELDALGPPDTDGLTDPDEVPKPPAKPTTQPGDLWACGQHRVLCGDSISAATYEGLLGEVRIDVCVTSPPYNVGMKYASYRDRAARKDYLAFIGQVGERVFAAMAEGRYLAWNIGVSPKTYSAHQVVTLEGVGFTFQRQIVWAKTGIPYPIFPSTLRTRRARHFKPNYTHEAIQVLKKPGVGTSIPSASCPLCEGGGKVYLGIACADGHEVVQLMTKGAEPELGARVHPLRRYQNDVWRIARSAATRDLRTLSRKAKGLQKRGQASHTVKEHPAAYPAELPRALLGFLAARGEACLDPFLGSGTTMIACEQLDLRCYGIEIEPRYVDVAVRRWQNFTGKKARRTDAKNKRRKGLA
jgi:DNA modification methylase